MTTIPEFLSMRMVMPGVLLALVLVSAPRAAAGPEDIVTAFMAAFNARDPARIASLYGADAELMPPDGPPVQGRPAIEAGYKAHFTEVRVLDLLSVHSDVSGSVAYVTGRLAVSTRTREHGADIVAGSYLMVLRLVAGEWKIAYHMFNLPLRPEYIG